MNDDPTRLLDEGSRDLRALLDAGRSELPDASKLGRLALKIGILAGGGAAGGGAAAVATAGTAKAAAGAVASKGIALGLIGKVTAAVLVTAVATTSVVVLVRQEARQQTPAPSTTIVVTTVATTPTPTPIPTPTPTPIPTLTPIPTPTSVAKPKAETPDAEVTLLNDALAAVQTSPERALFLCNDHARRFPSGSFTQEREVIAIEALMKLGRRSEASLRARRFEAAYPGSSHTRRIEALLGD